RPVSDRTLALAGSPPHGGLAATGAGRPALGDRGCRLPAPGRPRARLTAVPGLKHVAEPETLGLRATMKRHPSHSAAPAAAAPASGECVVPARDGLGGAGGGGERQRRTRGAPADAARLLGRDLAVGEDASGLLDGAEPSRSLPEVIAAGRRVEVSPARSGSRGARRKLVLRPLPLGGAREPAGWP